VRSASDGGAVLRVRHVDEVDDDDPADVAQAKLAHHLPHRLEVVLRDRVLEPPSGVPAARADEAPGVHVDDGERLRVVEDQIAAGREIDPPAQRRLDLLVDAERLHQRLLAVPDHALDHVRRRLLQVAGDALVRLVVVDVRLLEVAGEEVTRHTQRQLGLLVDQLRRLRRLRLRLDRLPEPLQEDEVALDVLLGRALGRGADDDAALLHLELAEDLLQPRALLVVEAARDAEPLALRDEDDEAAGQRDLRRQTGALRLHRVLHRLDEDRLALVDQVLDLAALAALQLGADDLVDVEEAVFLEADLDECGLHSRENVVDRAEIDVPGDRAAVRPLEVDLGDLAVLKHRDALLTDVDGDEQLTLRGRQRRAPRGLAAAAAALLAASLLPLRERLALGLALRLLLGLALRLLLGLRAGLRPGAGGLRRRRRLGFRHGLARSGAGLLAPAPAAAAAAALGLGGIGCSGRALRAGRMGYDRLGLSLAYRCSRLGG